MHEEHYFPPGADLREKKVIADESGVCGYGVGVWVDRVHAWQLLNDGSVTRYVKNRYQSLVLDRRQPGAGHEDDDRFVGNIEGAFIGEVAHGQLSRVGSL